VYVGRVIVELCKSWFFSTHFLYLSFWRLHILKSYSI